MIRVKGRGGLTFILYSLLGFSMLLLMLLMLLLLLYVGTQVQILLFYYCALSEKKYMYKIAGFLK